MASNNNAQSLDITVSSTKAEQFINQYKKHLLIGFGVILLIVLAWFGGSRWMSSREDAAQAQLALGEKYFTSQQYDIALNGDSVKSKNAFKGFLKISKEFTFTDAANVAHFYAGVCYAHKGDNKNAIKELEAFSPKGDATISPMAIFDLANCYAAENQLDKAVDNFKKAAEKADNPAISSIALLYAGQILEKQGKKEEANKVYNQIKSDYPTSQLSSVNVNNGVVIGAEIDKYIERTK